MKTGDGPDSRLLGLEPRPRGCKHRSPDHLDPRGQTAKSTVLETVY